MRRLQSWKIGYKSYYKRYTRITFIIIYLMILITRVKRFDYRRPSETRTPVFYRDNNFLFDFFFYRLLHNKYACATRIWSARHINDIACPRLRIYEFRTIFKTIKRTRETTHAFVRGNMDALNRDVKKRKMMVRLRDFYWKYYRWRMRPALQLYCKHQPIFIMFL